MRRSHPSPGQLPGKHTGQGVPWFPSWHSVPIWNAYNILPITIIRPVLILWIHRGMEGPVKLQAVGLQTRHLSHKSKMHYLLSYWVTNSSLNKPEIIFTYRYRNLRSTRCYLVDLFMNSLYSYCIHKYTKKCINYTVHLSFNCILSNKDTKLLYSWLSSHLCGDAI